MFFGILGHQDNFVFAANSDHDTIVNFKPGEDHDIDLPAFVVTSDISSWVAQHAGRLIDEPG